MNPQLTTRLRHLRLSGMVEALPGRVAQAEAAPLPHLEFLELLVEDELARRADRLFARRLKQAGITTMKTFADFDSTFNPKMPKTRSWNRPARASSTRTAAYPDWPTGCWQIAHCHGDRHRRDSRWPTRARAQHL